MIEQEGEVMSKRALKKSLRRKLNKETIQLTRKEYETLKEAERVNAANIINLIPLIILRDKFGFGKIRLERYLKHYQEAIESLNEGYLDLKDVERVMLEEVKIGFYEGDGEK